MPAGFPSSRTRRPCSSAQMDWARSSAPSSFELAERAAERTVAEKRSTRSVQAFWFPCSQAIIRQRSSAWTDLVEAALLLQLVVRPLVQQVPGEERARKIWPSPFWAELHGTACSRRRRQAGELAYYSGRGSRWPDGCERLFAQLAGDQHRERSEVAIADWREGREIYGRAHSARCDGHHLVWTRSLSESRNCRFRLKLCRRLANAKGAGRDRIKQMSAEDRLLVKKLYYFTMVCGCVERSAVCSRRTRSDREPPLRSVHAEARRRVGGPDRAGEAGLSRNSTGIF